MGTYKTDVTAGHDQRRTCHTDETKFPGESYTDSKTDDQGGNTLDDTICGLV